MTTSDEGSGGHGARPGGADPRPAAVSVITTEHFSLQGARSSTISESTGRASMFLSAISGGLVALGLVATATRVGTAFYVLSGHSLIAAVCSGAVTGIAVLAALLRYQRRLWDRALAAPLIISEVAAPQ